MIARLDADPQGLLAQFLPKQEGEEKPDASILNFGEGGRKPAAGSGGPRRLGRRRSKDDGSVLGPKCGDAPFWPRVHKQMVDAAKRGNLMKK